MSRIVATTALYTMPRTHVRLTKSFIFPVRNVTADKFLKSLTKEMIRLSNTFVQVSIYISFTFKL